MNDDARRAWDRVDARVASTRLEPYRAVSVATPSTSTPWWRRVLWQLDLLRVRLNLYRLHRALTRVERDVGQLEVQLEVDGRVRVMGRVLRRIRRELRRLARLRRGAVKDAIRRRGGGVVTD